MEGMAAPAHTLAALKAAFATVQPMACPDGVRGVHVLAVCSREPLDGAIRTTIPASLRYYDAGVHEFAMRMPDVFRAWLEDPVQSPRPALGPQMDVEEDYGDAHVLAYKMRQLRSIAQGPERHCMVADLEVWWGSYLVLTPAKTFCGTCRHLPRLPVTCVHVCMGQCRLPFVGGEFWLHCVTGTLNHVSRVSEGPSGG